MDKEIMAHILAIEVVIAKLFDIKKEDFDEIIDICRESIEKEVKKGRWIKKR